MTDSVDITPEEIESLLRDALDQAYKFVSLLPSSPSVTAVTLHIEHAQGHLEKEMDDERPV